MGYIQSQAFGAMNNEADARASKWVTCADTWAIPSRLHHREQDHALSSFQTLYAVTPVAAAFLVLHPQCDHTDDCHCPLICQTYHCLQQ